MSLKLLIDEGGYLVKVEDEQENSFWICREKYNKSLEKPTSKRDQKRQVNEKFQSDFISLMKDGVPRCLGEIGPVVGNTYITGLSARVRGLRKTIPAEYSIEFVKVGTPEEGTWYKLTFSTRGETFE